MNESIKAGADIHAGDGGYSEGTQEQYDAFVKVRNKSLAQGRIRELAEQAGMTDDKFGMYFAKDKHDEDGVDLEKFAELIVKECVGIVAKRKNQAIDDSWNVDEAMSMAEMDLEEHFGVEE
jgi:hypothetical protein